MILSSYEVSYDIDKLRSHILRSSDQSLAAKEQ